MSYQSPGVQPMYVPTYNYASWIQRVGAYIVDQLVGLASFIPAGIGIVLLIAGSDITSHTDYDGTEVIDHWSLNALAVVGIVVIVLGSIFAIVFAFWNIVFRQGRTGASIGKSAMGLVLLNESTGRPVGAGMSFVRQLAHIIDGMICYLGYLWPLWDTKRQTIADKCVSSVVVRTKG
ncbi:RDD family protein [Nocardioides sp.]|uniref:RDD family protein n=1 Tax=Nocardioides sp. TaxID=35761 RepID=UPI00262DF482|nr:RDD family protein [Nocardioides sp.]